jgi:hypothetical protein
VTTAPGRLVTDVSGFPLMIQTLEGNNAETTTMVPAIQAFATAQQLPDVTVVADARMGSAGNQKAIEDAGRIRWASWRARTQVKACNLDVAVGPRCMGENDTTPPDTSVPEIYTIRAARSFLRHAEGKSSNWRDAWPAYASCLDTSNTKAAISPHSL